MLKQGPDAQTSIFVLYSKENHCHMDSLDPAHKGVISEFSFCECVWILFVLERYNNLSLKASFKDKLKNVFT